MMDNSLVASLELKQQPRDIQQMRVEQMVMYIDNLVVQYHRQFI
jgi:hypothetical protein